MNDLERFQALQRLLVESRFTSSLEARREGDEAVFSLSVDVDTQNAEQMKVLAEVMTDNNFAFTIDGTHADISLLR